MKIKTMCLFIVSSFRLHPSSFPSCPLQRAFAPGVVVTNNQDSDEHKHLDERELRKGKIVAHKDDGPGQKKDCLDVKNQKQHRDNVIPDSEAGMGIRSRVDTTLVRSHLSFFVFAGTKKPAEDYGQDWKHHRHGEEDHHRPIRGDRRADVCRRRRCLKEHREPD